MAKYVAAVDQGTTSSRFMIFDHKGLVIGVDQKEFRQIYPKPGWVEHDAMEIMETVKETIHGALSKAGLTAQDLAAVGVTNQRETTVLWNKHTGKPYYNAIVWQDTRTDKICDELMKDGGQSRWAEKTGLPITTYFSCTKIKWILDNVPGVREDAEKGEVLFGNIDTWVMWNLTGGPDGGVHATDVSNASRTQLMDIRSLQWDSEICATLDIPMQMLPKILPSSFEYGVCKGELAGVPWAGDLGDQQAAVFGQTCYQPGEAKCTYGTALCLLMNTGTKPVYSTSGLLTTVGYKIGAEGQPHYILEGTNAMGGAVVHWLRDNLGLIQKSADVEDLAKTVEDNGGIYFVPAFSGLFAPYWKTSARGVIVGMTRYVNRGHFARAALEAICYQLREMIDAMNKDTGGRLASLRVDGGAVYDDLLMQFQADILNTPLIRPKVAETTALGAAYAAGLAVGYWATLDELRENWAIDKEWHPVMAEEEREKLYKGWLKAVDRSFDWIE